MSDSPKSNTIWWIAGGVVVAYLLYNHGTTGTVSTVTTGTGSNIGLPQTKRTVGGFTTRPTVGAAQTNLRNTTATGAISTTSASQQSILNGILAGINKLASKGGGISLGGGGGGGGGGNTPSSKNGNATGNGSSGGVSTPSTPLSTPSIYNGGSQSATSSTASGAAALSAASSTGSANSLVDPAQSALS
jgi:hypothetical protein